ncbi:MAG: acyl-CoA synthetase FdrA, partial [Candidatus Rokubacteria bacterium]|nr:acyl-CoA synthetase FdrA [Candidatus Rokubacteria bacterium]
MTCCLVRPDTYRDSVELMRVAALVEKVRGVSRAALMMATPANRELLSGAGLLDATGAAAGPNDLVVAVAAVDRAAGERALAEAARLLDEQAAVSAPAGDKPVPRSIAEAASELPRANLAIISTPGAYATAEALKALKRGLHVFIFSDNVPVADEAELKRLAAKKKLLVMGPDCGTAILDGVPLGFANAVRRGSIGLVGASGTGLQEISCLIDRLGEGCSQVIGVGGHDLDERVGGLMMQAGIERLAADPGTRVIVLVSKPPAPAVARRVLDVARKSGKPVVVNFLGGDPAAILGAGAIPAATLEDAARAAVALARGKRVAAAPLAVAPKLAAAGRAKARRFRKGQSLVRGLYSGGTLCQEAALILEEAGGQKHTTVDLGDDEFTVGRPHPMIDFRLRNERILAAAEDGATAVILLDVVLGYGAHADPAGALAPAIEAATKAAAKRRRGLAIVASVCGTPADPQGLERQETRLAAAGVLLAP